jgi:oligopeptidase A
MFRFDPNSTAQGGAAVSDLAIQNPILDRSGPPRFDEISAEHVAPAIRETVARVEEAFRNLESSATASWSGLIEPLERINEELDLPWHLVGHLMAVRNRPALRDAYQEMQPEVVRLSLMMGQSRPIYDRLVKMRDGEVWDTLDQGQRRVIELLIRAADHVGVGLDGEKRTRFNEIQSELATLSTNFSNNLLDATRGFSMTLTTADEMSGTPQNLRELAAQAAAAEGAENATPEKGPWRITLDYPIFIPFLENADRADLREKLYRALISRASDGELDNTDIISRILKLRREAAGIVGFDDYAALSIDSKMAEDVDDVRRLMEELLNASLAPAEKEFERLKAFAREQSGDAELELHHWDLSYWGQKLRERTFGYSEEDLRPYFPMPVVLDGLFALIHELFDVRIKDAAGRAPVWHEDVRYYEIENAAGESMATFYLDPYSRPSEKQGGAWQDGLATRSRALAAPGEDVRKSVAIIICNQTPPVGDRPALMSISEVRTLFHEFGHALQHMLSTVEYGMASGTRGIEWDAIEIPSMFMENWLFMKRTLKSLSNHIETGESLPDELIEKIRDARTFRAGGNLQRQLYLTLTDLELHHTYRPDGDETPFAVSRRVAERTALLPPLREDRHLCAFSHIFAGGYAAGYYSYLWAQVLSADAFSAFEDAGLDDSAAVVREGHRFRDTFLALGGSRPPMDVFVDFRGRKPTTDAILRHLGLVTA